MTRLPTSPPPRSRGRNPVTPSREDEVRPGLEVGGYRIERKLGAGGFGQVYLARREDGPCALKFLHLEGMGEWGWRELYILLRHEFPQVVRLRSHFKWPEEQPEYLVLVMEYIPGPPLYQWARDTTPSARELLEKLSPLCRALGDVHAQGVFHRDLKGDNVLVRETDGAAGLVDFGAGALPHAPSVTGALAPGNSRYRSPEAVAFFLRPDKKRGERHAYSVADELYALGVILYVLATDVYPFEGPEDDLLADILAGNPVPPTVRNARVPQELGDLCLRLLASEPHARVPNAEALCSEMEALLRRTRGDPRWERPLCYGWGPDELTTELPGNTPHARLRAWARRRPRRGKPPTVAAAPVPIPAPAPAEPPPAPRVPRDRRGRVGAGVAGACLVVGMAWVWSQRETEPAPPSGLFVWDPMPWATSIHEVAPPWKPPEADPGAAPSRVETPAPVTTVTLRTDTLPMKKARSPRAASVLLAMTAAANTACPAAQVRRNPPSEECPAGAVKTMTETLGLKMGDIHYASLPGFEPSTHHPVPVREGPISLELSSDWDVGASRLNAMDGRTVFPDRSTLSGQLFLGKERVYGRITQVVTPKGDAFTVCMDLVSDYYERGLEYETPGANAKVRPMGKVKIVKRFE